jgi:hypothetical protein
MMDKKLDWQPGEPEHAQTLPARFFYDPQVLEAERERIFYKAWHVVGHASELAEPGAYLTQEIFDQSVIVVRGADGAGGSPPCCAAAITPGATASTAHYARPRAARS